MTSADVCSNRTVILGVSVSSLQKVVPGKNTTTQEHRRCTTWWYSSVYTDRLEAASITKLVKRNKKPTVKGP